MNNIEDVKELVLRGLIKKGKFGGAHMPLDTILGHVSDKMLNDKKDRKIVDKAIRELVNNSWVIVLKKRTGKGSDLHISINPRRIKEIGEYLGGSGKAL
ncbi:MAG TPA: hypothetical protein VJG90_08155 [Candidatus Nanoarchaeia archaeon]|nr:hypothetical protein [Candidatus Nanoarchaeia archaeon]